MSDFRHVLSHFRGVREASPPNAFKAICPVHKDGQERNPSLYFRVGPTGRLLVKCFAGCDTASVIREAGLTMSDLFPDEGKPGARSSATSEPKRKIVATYDYTDEAGNLLYQVCRYEPKGFVQRTPNAGMKDGWQWMIPPETRKVLYQLPRIIRFDWPVVIVEGEKDADRLNGLGKNFVATTNVGGAHSWSSESVGKWLDCYSEALAGRRVVVIPDNDPPGQRHARYVLGSLLAFGVASARLVHLPNNGEIKDVSDYLSGNPHGGSPDKLIELIREAPEWRAASTSRVAA